jgi:hypothetical protein
VGANGSVLVADGGNNVVRAVYRDGTIGTVISAASGFPDRCDDGAAPRACDPGLKGGVFAVSADASTGDIYFAAGWVIRRLDARTQTVTRVAGLPDGPYECWRWAPTQMARDTPVASLDSILWVPQLGTLFYTSADCGGVFAVLPSGALNWVAGNGSIGSTVGGVAARTVAMPFPCGLAYYAPSGSLFVAEAGVGVVYEITRDGLAWPVLGRPGAPIFGSPLPSPAPVLSAELAAPLAVAVLGPASGQADALNASLSLVVSEGDAIRVLRADCVRTGAAASQQQLATLRATPLVCPAGASVVSTFAGTGVAGPVRDGGPAAQATLSGPEGLAVDPLSGASFIADSSIHVVRAVASNGTIITVAGVPSQSAFNGDGIATTRHLFSPVGLAVDVVGRVLWIADFGNRRVRALSLVDGNLSTIAGTGAAFVPQVAAPASARAWNFSAVRSLAWNPCTRSLYIADVGLQLVLRLRMDQGDISVVAGSVSGAPSKLSNVLATSLSLLSPRGLSLDLDSQQLFFSESSAVLIRAVNLTSGFIRTVAGTGTTASSYTVSEGASATATAIPPPTDTALIGGTLVFAAGPVVLGVDLATNRLFVAAGNGTRGDGGDGRPAQLAFFKSLSGLTYDAVSGTVLVADATASRVRAIGCASSPVIRATLNTPQYITGPDIVPGTPAAYQPASCPRPKPMPLLCPASRSVVTAFAGATGSVPMIDGVPANFSSFASVDGLAYDPYSNTTFVSDSIAHLVRAVAGNGTIGTLAGVKFNSVFPGDGPLPVARSPLQ